MKLQIVFEVLTLLLVAFVNLAQSNSISLQATTGEKIAAAFGCKKTKNSIVIYTDGESTTMMVYRFIFSQKPTPVKLKPLHGWKVTPSLLQYPNSNQLIVETVEIFLKHLKKVISPMFWVMSTVSIYASTDYRNVSHNTTEHILSVLTLCLRACGFNVQRPTALILESTRENFLKWFTLNLLLGRLARNNVDPAVMITKNPNVMAVVFAPKRTIPLTPSDQKNVITINSFKHGFSVYIKRTKLNDQDIRRKLFKNITNGNLVSPCLSPLTQVSWEYNGSKYTVKGSELSKSGKDALYEGCSAAMKDVLQVLGKCPSLSGQIVYATEDYYELGKYSGLIQTHNNGEIYMYQIESMAKALCEKPDPTFCGELVQMYTVFRYYYGMQDNDKIIFRGYAMGEKINWALAVAYINQFGEKSEK